MAIFTELFKGSFNWVFVCVLFFQQVLDMQV